MFNPMQMNNLMQMINSNPQTILQQAMRSSPEVAQLLQGVDVNNPQTMQRMCQNICLQKGIDYNTVMAQFNQLISKR